MGGFTNISNILGNFENFFTKFSENNNENLYKKLIPEPDSEDTEGWVKISEKNKHFYQLDGFIYNKFQKEIEENNDEAQYNAINKVVLPYTTRYSKIVSFLYQLEKKNQRKIQLKLLKIILKEIILINIKLILWKNLEVMQKH